MPSYAFTWKTSDFSMEVGKTATITLNHPNKGGDSISIWEDGVQIGTTTTNTYEYTPTSAGTHTLHYFNTIECSPLTVTVTGGGNVVSGNDTTTLNGALTELGETIADNLTSMGVTASANDGLTTLAGKILDIQTGGSCYHIEFSEASYTAIGGSATLEIYLQENYAPKSGASVTVTGSDGSVYNGITNSQGIASVTVSVSSETTFTCTYNNVSDTCTVNVVTYYIYDTCDTADGLSNYSNSYAFEESSTNTLSFNTDEYLLSGSGGHFSGREILALNGVENARLRIKFRLNTTSSGSFNQLFICCDDDAPSTTTISRPYSCRVRNDRLFQYFNFSNETTVYTHNTVFSNDWFYLEVEKEGTSWTIRLYDANLNQLATNTRTLESMNSPRWYFGLQTERGTNYSVHIKEIIAEPI